MNRVSYDNFNDTHIVKILADKLDNRKVPEQGKFDENGGESLEEYLIKFEKYCQANIRGDSHCWVDELESKLSGEMLELYKVSKLDRGSYESLKRKLLNWYEDTSEIRKKKAREIFEHAKYVPESIPKT